jgi:hypothetical protein
MATAMSANWCDQDGFEVVDLARWILPRLACERDHNTLRYFA